MRRHINGMWFICALAYLSLFCRSSFAQDITLYTMHYPPYTIDSRITPSTTPIHYADGMYGLDIDLIRMAYKTQGVFVHFKVAPWKRVMRDLRAGLILGGVSCRRIPLREPYALFSDPTSVSSVVLVTRKAYFQDESYTLDILQSYKTIAVDGWAQSAILDSLGIEFTPVPGLKQGLFLILHRNQDVFMAPKESLSYLAKKMDVLDQLSFYAIEGVKYNHYTVCFSKKVEGAEKWRDMLNKGLKVLRESGQDKDVYQHYGMTYPFQSL